MKTVDATQQPVGKTRRRTPIIIVVVALVLAAGGLGTWWALSRPEGAQRADVARLDKQRVIVDTSMNLYDPLVQDFTARYTNVVSESADEQEKETVLQQETERLQRESRTNRARLDQMAESPALGDGSLADAFNRFKEHYGAVVDYNDQRITNTANITRSVGGPCAPLHADLNVTSPTYAEDYVKTADACLGALADAKDTSDPATVELLTGIEGVIKGQRDKQQEVLDATSELERLAKRTTAGVALLDINDALGKVRTTYETAVKESSTKLVDEANSSNEELGRVLKERLDRFDAAGQEGK
ncbi:hypothetical protein [Paenarthrobacter sp. NCHU4564]|uniref:hypothetical protein n=1 Tax=Paenarthrobacter sp. NCHU4564 TaxID=3451353 RepID=UPI003F9E9788